MRSLAAVVALFPAAAAAAPSSAVEGVARAHVLAGRPDLAPADLRLERVEPWGLARFRRHHRGVPVVGGDVAVRVGEGGEALYTAAGRAIPPDLSVVPTVDPASAVRIASDGALDDPRGAALRVLALPGRPARLAWQVDLPVDLQELHAWRVFVDAQDGSLLERHDTVRRAGRGRAFPGGTPLAGGLMDVTLNLAPGAQRLVNADFTAFNCIDHMSCPIRYKGMDFRFCEIEQKAKADANGDFLYDRPASDADPEDALAEVNMFYHADLTVKKFRSLGLDKLADLSIPTYVNVRMPMTIGCDTFAPLLPWDNAAYVPGNSDFFFGWPTTAALIFGQGPIIDNAYEGDTIYHELTHAMQQRLHGDLLQTYVAPWGLSVEGGSMGEATADFYAAAITNDPVVFEYSLEPKYQRDLSQVHKCPADLTGEVHEDSKIFSSALWTARKAFPEAQRETFDKALMRAMGSFIDTDGFNEAQAKIVTELRALAGDTAAETAATAFHSHGIDGCSDFVADLPLQTPWPLLFLWQSDDFVLRTPAVVQWRLDLPQAYDRLVVTFDDSSFMPPRGTVTVVTKPGRDPIHWNVDMRTHDGKQETPVSLIGARDAIIPGPFPAGPVVLQLVLAKNDASTFNGLIVVEGVRFRGDFAPVVPDAGPKAGEDDGGGCATGGGAPSAGFLLVILLLASRRRRW